MQLCPYILSGGDYNKGTNKEEGLREYVEPLEAFKTDFKNPFPSIQREFYRVAPAKRWLFVARPGDAEPGFWAGINPPIS